eukprot:m.168009 g.168009  ORF g.168009 m.168009 type:complete len:261 (-) comp17785_c0_seq2:86-868(-)
MLCAAVARSALQRCGRRGLSSPTSLRHHVQAAWSPREARGAWAWLAHTARGLARYNNQRVQKLLEQHPKVQQGAVTLYECDPDRGRFFKLMTLASLSQTVFWFYAANLASDMQAKPGGTDDLGDASDREETDGTFESDKQDGTAGPTLESAQLRGGLVAMSLVMSASFFALGYLIPRRYVKSLVVSQYARSVKVETFAMFGFRTVEVPVSNIAFRATTEEQARTLGFQITNHRFFFMLDMQGGKTLQPQLLSQLVALRSI